MFLLLNDIVQRKSPKIVNWSANILQVAEINLLAQKMFSLFPSTVF